MGRRWAPLLALPLLGCVGLLGLPPRVPDCPGELLATGQLGPDFAARERLTLAHGEQIVRLDLALQKHDGALVLVGFDPLGAKLFSVVQRGSQTDVEAAPRAILPVPPLNVLRDVHRARFAAPTDALVTHAGAETLIRNPRCGSETRLLRVSERRLP